MTADPIVIVAAKRTALGGMLGDFAALSASDLGGAAIRAAVAEAGLQPGDIDSVLMGNVLGAGQGQAPARQAALKAGLTLGTPCTTLNKMCGSGMQAVMLAHDQLMAGSVRVAVAGGMESMTNAPYLLPKMRAGARIGHGQVMDHMFLDGLEDAYDKGRLMGTFAEDCAERYAFTREEQDAYALASLSRALEASANGAAAAEIVPVEAPSGRATVTIAEDQQPKSARPDKIPTLKPAFRKDGTVTAANSSSISDGAAALVLMRASEAAARGLKPLARITGQASYAHEPGLFTTAPVSAINRLMERTGWTIGDVDLWEVNEAFAVVPMVAMRDLGIPHEKMNVLGGACALGHPIGASGARILVTLLNALKRSGGTRGVAAVCIGGGEATAMGVELVGG
ncbi:acetyl-CoA C-acyltransferase [Pararhodobacter sp.]|uniref:acetyl-CoA C-acyltransferase n=1 Tax=Pararhodobacter sp. TaxID=2127056 RepID=UPI002FE02406